MSMDEIMREWPATIRVVLDHGMLCVGCPIAPFHTIEDAVREHHLDGDRFRAAMKAAIRG
jgi:hybrid cluster-associated redox disulfide protein